jgi:multidrug efflux pump subunit AcrA (membrane-fusion protein)
MSIKLNSGNNDMNAPNPSLQQSLVQLQRPLSELIEVCNAETEHGLFFNRFLVSAIKMVGGMGGLLFIRHDETLAKAFQAGKLAEAQPLNQDNQPGSDEHILETISHDIRPTIIPLAVPAGERDNLIGVYIPIQVDNELFAVCKIVKKSDSNVVFQEEVELLLSIGEFVRIFLAQIHLPKVMGRMQEIGSLFELSKEIFSSVDPVEIAYTIANQLPGLIECNRVIVGLVHKKKMRVTSITGMDLIERKSNLVQSLEELLSHIGRRRQAMTIKPDMDISLLGGGLKDIVDGYFKVNPFKVLHVLPVMDGEILVGVVCVESSEKDEFNDNELTLLNFIIKQAAIALNNARMYKEVPLAGFWRKFYNFRETSTGWQRLRLFATPAVIMLLLLSIFIVKIDNKIKGSCEVFPSRKIYGRSNVDGIVKEFLVAEGDLIEPGATVALLDTARIDMRLREARSRLLTVQSNMVKYFGEGKISEYEIEKLRIKEIELEIGLLESDLGDTRVTVGQGGIVTTPNPRFIERVGKPVSRGEELVEIGSLQEMLLEITVPESDIRYVKADQTIRIMLNSLPEHPFEARVLSVRQQAEVRQEGNVFVVEANLGKPERLIRPGMRGVAKIYTGKASLYDVYLVDMVNYFRVKLFL